MGPPGRDPYGSPFGAVPPPPELDHRKGKGKGKGHYGEHDGEGRGHQPDGLVVSNVPAECNSLDVLNRHFRQFGEVLKITVHATEGKAFVQFADHGAAQSASAAPVLDQPEITMAWAARGEGKGKGKGKTKGKDRPSAIGFVAEHRVLCSNPEEQRRLDDNKRKRDDITSRRNTLLSQYTQQLQMIMAKLNVEGVSEAKRESLRSLILQIKGKMDALSTEVTGGFDEAGKGKSAKRPKGEGKGADSAEGGKGGKKDEGKRGGFTLDLRPKVLRVNLAEGWTQERLREELAKLGASEDKIAVVHLEGAKAGEDGKPGVETALVQFKDRKSAELVFNKKGEDFVADWSTDLPPVPEAVSPVLAPAAAPAESSLPPAALQRGQEDGEGEPAGAEDAKADEEEPAAAAAAADSAAAAATEEAPVAAADDSTAATEAIETAPVAAEEGAADFLAGDEEEPAGN